MDSAARSLKGRPESLFPLFSALNGLRGIGPKLSSLFKGLGIELPRDLLFHLPQSGVSRRLRRSVREGSPPEVVTVEVTIGAHMPPRQRQRPYRVLVADSLQEFQLVFFHAHVDSVQRLLPTGQSRVISGRLEVFDGLYQMTHPDFVLRQEEYGALPEFEPVYPLTAGMTQKQVRKAIALALQQVPALEEWIDLPLVARERWPDWAEAVRLVHAPNGPDDLAPSAPARQRLAYDEFFAHQLTLALARQQQLRAPGVETRGTGALLGAVLASLPYAPTGAQQRAIEEITADMAAPRRMNRLLQGDVGAGKTLVALAALLTAVEAGGQGALMAPTEILARQHFESISPLVEPLGVQVVLLTGRDKGRERDAKLEAIASGQAGIVIGTHALFQKQVNFADLRLAVVDEQHRFGVAQRMALGEKGPRDDARRVDSLVMTATPIPRSLALAQYGDMDLSLLDEKPPGRQPIVTTLASLDRLSEVVEHLGRAMAAGQQAYWVCPLVEESEVLDLTAAQSRFEALSAVFGDRVGLVHGQLAPSEKDAAMARFLSGETRLLVATTVIEVGVNVPSATIMVIERAEIFGLAQLHQLRGRVGRGAGASTCLLLYDPPLNESAARRLRLMRETEDGFRLSDEDLAMRGAGDVIGTVQSGLPRFRIGNLETQASLMAIAQSDARRLLADDPGLMSARGRAARNLLWLTGQDRAIRLIQVG